MTELPGLNDQVIVVRWDEDAKRIIVDIGQMDVLSATAMLQQASERCAAESDEPILIWDGVVMMTECEGDDDDS